MGTDLRRLVAEDYQKGDNSKTRILKMKSYVHIPEPGRDLFHIPGYGCCLKTVSRPDEVGGGTPLLAPRVHACPLSHP